MGLAEVERTRVEKSASYVRVITIARGGLGTVELVMREEGRFRRLYALKRLHPHLRDDMDIRTMFKEEARVAGMLRHPNVVSVLDVGEDDEGPYLLMDYVEGLPLSRLVSETRRSGDLIPLSICLQIIRYVASGLSAAHQLVGDDGPLALVHRDVSPQNILVGFDGSVRVTDFGIAKAMGGDVQTTTHTLKGKYGYMSPEQLRFERLDPRSDLFALGVVAWEMIAARRLYKEKSLEDTAARILREPPPELEDERADVLPSVEALILSLLAKDREQRPASAAEVVRAIDETLRDVEVVDGSYALVDYMEERFGALRDEVREKRGEAIAAARAGASAPAMPGTVAPRRDGGRRPGVRRLIPLVLGVALGAAALWGLQAFFSGPEADVAAPAAHGDRGGAPRPREESTEEAPPPIGPDVAPESAVTTEPAPTERPRVRRHAAMGVRRAVAMEPPTKMTAVDEWWTP